MATDKLSKSNFKEVVGAGVGGKSYKKPNKLKEYNRQWKITLPYCLTIRGRQMDNSYRRTQGQVRVL